MLTMTTTAADAVRALVANTEIDDDTGGLRISSDGGQSLELALVDRPDVSDTEVESAGARVFLPPDIAPALDEMELDAQVAEGRVQFALAQQNGH